MTRWPGDHRFTLIHGQHAHGVPDLLASDALLADRLWRLGLRSGMTLACRLEDRFLQARLLFLLPRLGCLFLPLDPDLPREISDSLLAVAGDCLVLDEPGMLQQDVTGKATFSSSLSAGDVQLLLATSGTTGEPRLVELTGENLLSSARACSDWLGLQSVDRWLACLPLHHIGGLSILLRCACKGATVVLLDAFSAADVMASLHERRITHLSLVPAMLHALLQQPHLPPASLRVLLLGGAPATQSLVQEALEKGWPVCPSYGLTEAASQVATLCPAGKGWQEGQVGQPLPHVQLKLRAETGAICIRGPSVSRGIRGPGGARIPLLDTQGWLETGDLGRLDDKGCLQVMGRRDDLLISGGENLHPAAVEKAFSSCPGLRDHAITAVAHPRWGDALVLLYQGDVRPDVVRAWARCHLNKAWVPKYYFPVPALPRNSLGKLLRRALRSLAEDCLNCPG